LGRRKPMSPPPKPERPEPPPEAGAARDRCHRPSARCHHPRHRQAPSRPAYEFTPTPNYDDPMEGPVRLPVRLPTRLPRLRDPVAAWSPTRSTLQLLQRLLAARRRAACIRISWRTPPIPARSSCATRPNEPPYGHVAISFCNGGDTYEACGSSSA
jgi:hypothetical protein